MLLAMGGGRWLVGCFGVRLGGVLARKGVGGNNVTRLSNGTDSILAC